MDVTQGRDWQWFEASYQTHEFDIRRYATRRVGADAADDIVAEVFTTLWRRRGAAPEPVRPRLFRVAADPAAQLTSTSPTVLTEEARLIAASAPGSRRWRWLLLVGLAVVVALIAISSMRAGSRVPVLASPSPTSTTSTSPSPTSAASPDAHTEAVALLALAAANPPEVQLSPGQYLAVHRWGTLVGPVAGMGDPLLDGWITSIDETRFLASPGSPYSCLLTTQTAMLIGTYGSIDSVGWPSTPIPAGAQCWSAPAEGDLVASAGAALPSDEQALALAVAQGSAVRNYLEATTPAETRSAMLNHLAGLPTLTVTAVDVDVLGRPGTAVTVPGQLGAVQHHWFFDQASGAFLGTKFEVDAASYVLAVDHQVLDALPEPVVTQACAAAAQQAGDPFNQSVCPA